MANFSHFNLPPVLAKTIDTMGFTTPTPVQAASIPFALESRDILATAQTGSGKTAAFVIPLIANLWNQKIMGGLILTPTRELAMQVFNVLKSMLSPGEAARMALLIGGDPMVPQIKQLQKKPRIIVGTPGRVIDHLKRGNLYLGQTNFLVLDEADRMLDMGFGLQLEEILPKLSAKRQTLLFTATLPDRVASLAQRYLQDPEVIKIGDACTPSLSIKQEVVHTTGTQKYQDLLKELQKREGSIIVFVATKRSADQLAYKLESDEQKACAMHGDLQQRKRERLISSFRAKKFRVMVATDVAARGLDIAHVEHVINFDLPRQPEDYVHRIGRTGRAGQEGSAVSLLLPEDKRHWAFISRFINGDSSASVAGNEGKKQGSRFGAGKPRFNQAGGGRKDTMDRGGRSDRPQGAHGKSARPYGDKARFGDRPLAERAHSNRSQFDRAENTGARDTAGGRTRSRNEAPKGPFVTRAPQSEHRLDTGARKTLQARPRLEARNDNVKGGKAPFASRFKKPGRFSKKPNVA